MVTEGADFIVESGDDPAGLPVAGNGATGPNPMP